MTDQLEAFHHDHPELTAIAYSRDGSVLVLVMDIDRNLLSSAPLNDPENIVEVLADLYNDMLGKQARYFSD